MHRRRAATLGRTSTRHSSAKYNEPSLIAHSACSNSGLSNGYLSRSMFDELSEKLEATFARLRGRGVLTEADIKDGLREVRRVLLEADVNFQLTREFLERVEKKAVGVAQLRTVSPGAAARQDRLRRAHHHARRAARGAQAQLRSADDRDDGRAAGLRKDDHRRQARAQAQGAKARPTRLVACDVYRPAAIDQLETLGAQLDVPVYADRTTQDVVKIAKAGIEQATPRARSRGHHRHRRPSADRRRDDGRAGAAQGGDPPRRDPARRRRHDRARTR